MEKTTLINTISTINDTDIDGMTAIAAVELPEGVTTAIEDED